MAATVKSRRLLEAAEKSDIALMVDMRRTHVKKNETQSVPECLEGKVTHATILDKLKQCYEELYNSDDTKDVVAEIKTKIQQLVKDNFISSENEVLKLTSPVVKQASSKIYPGKTVVTEGTPVMTSYMHQSLYFITWQLSSDLLSTMGQ